MKRNLKFTRVSASGWRKIEKYTRHGYIATRRAIRIARIEIHAGRAK